MKWILEKSDFIFLFTLNYHKIEESYDPFYCRVNPIMQRVKCNYTIQAEI